MSFDTTDTSGIRDTSDAAQESAGTNNSLSPVGQKAMQGDDVTAQPEPSPDSQPAVATTELGADLLAETGPEKPEVKLYHNIIEDGEGDDSEGTSEGWRPGGPERG